MAGARPFILSLVVVSVIAYLMLMAAYSFITVKNPDSEIFDEKYGLGQVATQMSNSMSQFNNVTNVAKEKFIDSKPQPQDFVFLIFYGAFQIPYTLFGFVGNGIAAITNSLSLMLGRSLDSLYPGIGTSTQGIFSMLIGILISGVILTGIFLLIKAIRGGESENR